MSMTGTVDPTAMALSMVLAAAGAGRQCKGQGVRFVTITPGEMLM
jgi:hypothetical protein